MFKKINYLVFDGVLSEIQSLFLIGKYNVHEEIGHAAIMGQTHVVKFCVDNGANLLSKNWALISVSQFGFIDIVQYLVENGANVNFHNAVCLQRACNSNHLEIAKYLILNGANLNFRLNNTIITCCKQGNLNILQFLVENGADINMYRYSDLPIETAVVFDQLKIVKYLVENGADIYVNNEDCLQKACQLGYLDIVKYLVEKGANIHVTDDDLPIIQYAYDAGKVSVVFYLLSFYDKDLCFQFEKHDNFEIFYILITTFYNDEKWSKIPNVKQDYLFDPNLSLIIASFAF